MTRLIADTNVFLRFILKDNPKQYEDARKLFTSAKENKVELLVPQIVIFEIAFALEKYYQFAKDQIIDRLRALLSAGYLKIQDRDIFKRALDFYQSQNTSFVDCFLIAKAEGSQANIFTFDKNLNRFLKG
ncbi:MAG: hypothetical protein A2Z11_03575 [Candidatus Woykebacteria bacterium RBG_16_43_9]|uniref:PIN domain-containing protein n=1 Tax=Candidatus Woykebacteria bacterium RBG_16_43_9 TaxID=1802596 RepID=A0A1G1WCQ6_9BACT|nr:MAG: hypothetical protein A2Z11_03575 [Candidatus Woykebacteria bacterium RBG_16_43_9]